MQIIRLTKFIFYIFISSICITCKPIDSTDQDVKMPNVVFILVDDLGYSDVGYMGHKAELCTPNIDALAESGMVFTQAYAAAPVCSPTRASILTGKSPAALRLTCHIPGLPMGQYFELQHRGKNLEEAFFKDHLPIDEVTIADELKKKGYATGFFGKWHLAGSGSARSQSDGIINEEYHPEYQGFDINIGGCAYGQPSAWFDPYQNATIKDSVEGEYLTDRIGNEAANFIDQNKENPFFLYLSTYTVHTPLKAPQKTIDKNDGDTYRAMIEELDQNIGKIMTQLAHADLLENTMVIFYSDNGGLWGNTPLRGNKGSLHEGGIRVPLIINWQNKIAASKTAVPVTSVDFLPTILEVTGISRIATDDLEGVSLWPLLASQQTLEERPLYWHFPHFRNEGQDMGAIIREGDWKLIWDFETDSLFLYDLQKDLAETNNLSEDEPEKTAQLLSKLKEWQAEVQAEMPNKISQNNSKQTSKKDESTK